MEESLEAWFHEHVGTGRALLFEPDCVYTVDDYEPLVDLLTCITDGEMTLSRFWGVDRGNGWRVQFSVAGERSPPVRLRALDGMVDLIPLLESLNSRAEKCGMSGRFVTVGSADLNGLCVVGWVQASGVQAVLDQVARRQTRRSDIFGLAPGLVPVS